MECHKSFDHCSTAGKGSTKRFNEAQTQMLQGTWNIYQAIYHKIGSVSLPVRPDARTLRVSREAPQMPLRVATMSKLAKGKLGEV